MKKATLLFLIVLVVACSAESRKRFGVANSIARDMGATGVTLGTQTTTEDGVRKRFTKLTFSGLVPANWDEDGLRYAANYAAWKFIDRLTPREFGPDTLMKVRMEMTDKQYYEYELPVSLVKKESAFIPIAKRFVEAMLVNDTVQLRGMSHETYLPDSNLRPIYAMNVYYDSLFAGKRPQQNLKGFYDAVINELDMSVHQTLYYVETDEWLMRYILDIDRETKKVVYISMNSEKK